MMNQIILGTIVDDRLCAIHRNDGTGMDFPVKYWPDGPGTLSGDEGWYFYDGDLEGTDEGFMPHPFNGRPFDYPVVNVFNPEYNAVCLLVIVPDYTIIAPEWPVMIKPATPSQLQKFINRALGELDDG